MNDWLASQGRWRAGDALRLVILASIPAAMAIAGGPAAAAMLLTLGGAMALRFSDAPLVADLVGQSVLLAAAWFAAAGAYELVPGLDVVAHLASGAVLALLVRSVMTRAGLLPVGAGRTRAVARTLHTATAVVMLGLLWELGEWAGHAWITTGISVGYEDTLVDLVADGIGALIASLVRERSGARRRTAV